MWTSLLNFRKKRRGKKPKSADEDKSEPSDPVEMKRMTIQTPGKRNKVLACQCTRASRSPRAYTNVGEVSMARVVQVKATETNHSCVEACVDFVLVCLADKCECMQGSLARVNLVKKYMPCKVVVKPCFLPLR